MKIDSLSSSYYAQKILRTALNDSAGAIHTCLTYEARWGFDELGKVSDYHGNNLLMYIVMSNDRFKGTPIIENYYTAIDYVLTRIGVSPNDVNYRGNTTLHLVGESYLHVKSKEYDKNRLARVRAEIIAKLLAAGANPFIRNNQGLNALDFFKGKQRYFIQVNSQF